MERPQGTLALALHLARLRWQGLSTRARMGASVAFAVVAVGSVFGARMAMSGACCASGCPMERARMEAAAAEAHADGDCASAHAAR